MKNKRQIRRALKRPTKLASGDAKPPGPLLTLPEQLKLLKTFRLHGRPGFTEEEANALFGWAAETRHRQGILELALEGLVRVVDFKAGAPAFDVVREVDDLPAKCRAEKTDQTGPGHPGTAPDGDGADREAGQAVQAPIPTLPEEARERLIKEMAERVGAWFHSRAEEVLEEPHTYGEDLEDIRLQICGAVAEDLEQDYGEGVEAMIRKAYTDAGLPTGVAGP